MAFDRSIGAARLIGVALARVTCLVAACSFAGMAQAQDTLVRETEFSYNLTSGLLDVERVDPGGTHCVETQYQHDTYGNRERITVKPCTSTIATASFTPRVTVNEFLPGPSYPAGAYLTRRRSGAEVSPGSGVNTMAETKADFDAKHGLAIAVTEVAVGAAANTRDLKKRTAYDALGRVTAEYVPVQRNTSTNAVTESRVDYVTVYCLGPKAVETPPPAGTCLNVTGQTVTVNYASKRLVDTAGAFTTTANVNIISAYYVESTPKDSGGNVIGARSRVHFDSLHREIAKESENYDGKWSRTMTGYDQLGQQAISWGPHFSDASAAELADLRQWTSARDHLHRPTVTKQKWRGTDTAAGSATEIDGQIQYSGLSVTTTVVPLASAPGGQPRSRTTRKNAVGQTAQTIDPYGATLNMAYDGFGNLVKTVDPLGFTTTITYSATTARFKTAMTDPDKGSWSYTYDALGQLKSQTDGRAITTTLTYDALGRMTAKSTPGLNAGWKYSTTDLGAVQCADGLPRLCESFTGPPPGTPPGPSTRRQILYDELGRAKQTTETLDRAYVSATTFDALGRPATFTYPSGLALKYTYSDGTNPSGKRPGFLVTVADNATSARQFWSIAAAGTYFDARGNLLKAALGNGITLDNRFDPISAKALALRAGTGGSLNNKLDQSYSYDQSNNLISRSNGFNGGIESFEYDLLDRLTKYIVDSPDNSADRTVTVGYNAIGNILTKSDVGGYYYAGNRPHAVSTAGATSYTYDANGNLLSSAGTQNRTNTWTDFNLPNTLAYNGTTVAFQYDDQYKRVQETFTSGTAVRKLWLVHPNNAGGLSFEREETIVNGAVTRNESRHYISVGGAVIGVVKTLNPNAQGQMTVPSVVSTDANLTLYWHKDSLGSIVAVSNAVGTVIERPAFDAWGRRLLESRAIDYSASGPAHGDRGYTGHEHLDEVALVHMNGRLYDAVLGRFFSPDPVNALPLDLQSYNAYSYVLNNPLRYTDPSGLCFFGPDCVIEIFIAIASVAAIDSGNKYWRMAGQIGLFWAIGPGGGLAEAGLGAAVGPTAAAAYATEITVLSSMIAGGATGFVSSGGNLEAAFAEAVFAGVLSGIGVSTQMGTPAKVFGHALVGCVRGEVTGGGCGPSAMAATFGKLTTVGTEALGLSGPAHFAVTTLAGGTASVIGGGKFANGAMQAAMGYLFNQVVQMQRQMLVLGAGATLFWNGGLGVPGVSGKELQGFAVGMSLVINTVDMQLALQFEGSELKGAGYFIGGEGKIGVQVSKDAIPSGRSTSISEGREFGVGLGKTFSFGGSVQAGPDGAQVSVGAGRHGAGLGLYGAESRNYQTTFSLPPLRDLLRGIFGMPGRAGQ